MQSHSFSPEDRDALPGERWFPRENAFQEDIQKFWGPWGVTSEVETLQSVLLHRPGPEVEDFDVQKARFRGTVNPQRLRAQHDNLAQLYKEHGVTVHYIEEQRRDRPNALFVRDLMFMTAEGAILGRPAMETRRGEERYAAQTLAKLGVPILKTVRGNGIFEGANAMWVDAKTVILATGSRTNSSGYEQVYGELKRLGVQDIILMQIPYGHAHIDGILNMASPEHVMIHASQVPYDVCAALRQRGIKILEAPSQTEAKETMGINFVVLRPGLLVQPAGNPRCKALLEENGLEVLTLDISEILKGWGGLHCATAFLKRG